MSLIGETLSFLPPPPLLLGQTLSLGRNPLPTPTEWRGPWDLDPWPLGEV